MISSTSSAPSASLPAPAAARRAAMPATQKTVRDAGLSRSDCEKFSKPTSDDGGPYRPKSLPGREKEKPGKESQLRVWRNPPFHSLRRNGFAWTEKYGSGSRPESDVTSDGLGRACRSAYSTHQPREQL